MGAELGARAMSHLEEITDTGIEAMAKANSVAVILPTTAYILRLKHPPVRKLIESGVPVALGTDFNPNAFCLSMVRIWVYPQIRLQYGIKIKAAISLSFNLHYKAIAALFFIPFCRPN